MQYNKRIIACMAILLLGSCNKYLDKKSDTTLVTPSTVENLQALLDDNFYMNRAVTPSYGEASADDYFLPGVTYNNMQVNYQLQYTWQPLNYSQLDWGACYYPVYVSNLCLDLLPAMARTAVNAVSWDNVKGSAYFFRSYYFLWLLWNYGKAYDAAASGTDPGIVLRLSSDFNVASTRSSVKDCYDQVIQDAKASVKWLPDYPQHVMRPSKSAAWGLLARCYLSMRQYDSALIYAQKALALDGSLMDYNGTDGINGSLAASLPFKQFNKEIVFYSEKNTSFAAVSASRARMDTILYGSYIDNDLRKIAFFGLNAGYYQFKGTYGGVLISQQFSGIATDELWLIAAECNARAGNIDPALTALNKLLVNRYKTGTFIPVVERDQDKLVDTILMERRKELLMRGLRWPDIKRLNKEGRNIVPKRLVNGTLYTLPPNDDFYALPLPYDIIELTGIQGNSGNQ